MEGSSIKATRLGRLKLSGLIASLAVIMIASVVCLSILGGGGTLANGESVDADLNPNGVPYLKIVSHNLDYDEYMHIALAVEYSEEFMGETPTYSTADVKLLVWSEGQTDYTITNAAAAAYIANPSSETPPEKYPNSIVFLSNDIPAKDITDTFYFRAYIELSNGTVFYSDVSKYSVLQYVYNLKAYLDAGKHLTGIENETEIAAAKEKAAAQYNLIDKILAYGNAAQVILGDSTEKLTVGDYVQVKLVNAAFDDRMNHGLFTVGDTLEMTATPPASGLSVAYWTLGDGTVIEGSEGVNVLSLNIGEDFSGSTTVTAVYSLPTNVTVIGGTVSGNGVFYNGDTYTVTAETTEHFAYWLVDGVKDDTLGSTFTAPAKGYEGGDVKYEAVYYEPTTVTVTGGTGAGSYYYNDTYTVTASVAEGQSFGYWLVDGVKDESLEESFTKTVTAEKAASVNYEAVCYLGEGAHFENLTASDEKIRKANPVTTNGFTVYQSSDASTDITYATITTDPKNETNTVIKSVKNDMTNGNSIYFNFDKTYKGDEYNWFVMDVDLMIEETASNTTISQIRIGSNNGAFYQIEMKTAGNKIYIYDYNHDYMGGGRNFLLATVPFGEWFNLRVEFTNGSGITLDPDYEYEYNASNNITNLDGAIVSNDAKAYIYVNNECIAQSSNIWTYTPTTGPDGTRTATLNNIYNYLNFYSLKSEKVTMYIDNVQGYGVESINTPDTTNVKAFSVPTDQSKFDNRYDLATAVIGSDAVEALKKMDNALFGQSIYLWIAELYDPITGAIYYSNSARDTYGYLPDIESTNQALSQLARLGIANSSVGKDVLTDAQRAKLGAWIQLCQSGRDGYYYHPQWGTDIGDSRKGRDLGNYTSHLNNHALGEELFDGANYRIAVANNNTPNADLAGTTKAQTWSAATSSSALVMCLGLDTETAVAMAVSAVSEDVSEDATEETPATDLDSSSGHLANADALLAYLEEKWAYYSYNSYTFGNYITSQNAQVKSANLGEVVINFFNDIQDSVQKELEARAYDDYYYKTFYTENEEVTALYNTLTAAIAYREGRKLESGSNMEAADMDSADAAIATARAAYRAKLSASLTADQQAELDAAVAGAGNGLWETMTNGRTISGLLKISGIYNSLESEFKYVDKAINSAVTVLLWDIETYQADESGITYIYNPPSAISNMLKNIKNYGSEENAAVRTAAYRLLQEKAYAIITQAEDKLAIYKKDDGGVGYHVNKASSSSQGEPAAVAGSNESDVNGTALALGTRAALISIFSLSEIPILHSYEQKDSVTATINGTEMTFDSHLDCFIYAMNNHTHDKALKSVGEYDFENVSTYEEAKSKYGISDSGSETYKLSIGNPDENAAGNALLFNVSNSNSNAGATVNFTPKVVASTTNYYEATIDIYDNLSSLESYLDSNETKVSGGQYELFFRSGSSDWLKILMMRTESGVYFKYQYRYDQSGESVSSTTNTLKNASGATQYFSVQNWMTVSIKYYPDAKDENGNAAPYGVFTVTQGDVSASMKFTGTYAGASAREAFDTFRFYASYAKYGQCYIDNLEITEYSTNANTRNYYHFDDVSADLSNLPQLNYGDATANIVAHTDGRVDKYLALAAATGSSINASIIGDKETGYYNFNEVMVDFKLVDYAVGDTGHFNVLDSAGKVIISVGYEIIEVTIEGAIYESVRFYEQTSGITLLAGQHDANLENDKVTVNALDYIIDPAEWITLRFEYHYDRSVSGATTLYLTARYTDGEGLADAKAAILENLPVAEADAVAANMSKVDVLTNAGAIYIDNFYVRNVYNIKAASN